MILLAVRPLGADGREGHHFLVGLIADVKKMVVPIETRHKPTDTTIVKQQGTAAVLVKLDPAGSSAVVLTCAHIFYFDRSGGHWREPESTATLRLNLDDGSAVRVTGHMAVADTFSDVALLSIDWPTLPANTHIIGVTQRGWWPSDSLLEGDQVLYIGYPQGLGIGSRSYPLSRTGIVAQLTNDRRSYVIDGFAQGGHSGSPVFVIRYRARTKGNEVDAYLAGIASNFLPVWESIPGQAPPESMRVNPGFTVVSSLDPILPAIEEVLLHRKPPACVDRTDVLVDTVRRRVEVSSVDDAEFPPPVQTASGRGQANDYFRASISAHGAGRTVEAIALLDSAIGLYPLFPSAFHNRSYYRFTLRDTAGALADADRAVELNPDDPSTRGLRSKIRAVRGDYRGALADAVAGLSVASDKDVKASLFVHKGVAERHLGRFTDAESSLRSALHLAPKNAAILLNLANVGSDQERPAVAESLLSLALALDSTYAQALDYRGNARYRLRNFNGALADHTAAARLDPARADFLYDRQLDYRALGMKDSAITDLRRAMELDPSDPVTQSSLGLALAEEANELARLLSANDAKAKWLEAIGFYETSLKLPRMSKGRAAVVEGWLALAKERYEDLYGGRK